MTIASNKKSGLNTMNPTKEIVKSNILFK